MSIAATSKPAASREHTPPKKRGQWGEVWKRLKRNKMAIFGLGIFARGNPKFCVTAKSGANREKFIMGGRRVKRLPPC